MTDPDTTPLDSNGGRRVVLLDPAVVRLCETFIDNVPERTGLAVFLASEVLAGLERGLRYEPIGERYDHYRLVLPDDPVRAPTLCVTYHPGCTHDEWINAVATATDDLAKRADGTLTDALNAGFTAGIDRAIDDLAKRAGHVPGSCSPPDSDCSICLAYRSGSVDL